MGKKVQPSKGLQGEIHIPGDKSITHRAVLLSSLADGESTIKNPLMAEDCLSSLSCIQQLGCEILKYKGEWRVIGRGKSGYTRPSSVLNCGNSGTTMRLISGILAGQDFETQLVGDASLSQRPMSRIAVPLSTMGIRVDMSNGQYPPLRICGSSTLRPIEWVSKIASAQVKSALLLAALHAKGKSMVSEPTLSRDHTERMLMAAGVPLLRRGTTLFLEGPGTIKTMRWIVPGDFSSAAFFIIAALITGNSNLVLKNINLNPTRTGLLDILNSAGGKIITENVRDEGGEPLGDIKISTAESLVGFTVTKDIVPRLIDEIPVLAVLATQTKGVSTFEGIEELRVKETDRIKAIVTNLKAMGANVEETEKGFSITGPTPLKGAAVSSEKDHRIAMAFAVAGLVASGTTEISDESSVNISFPGFWTYLDKISVN